jgi:hypothetical protein
MKATVSMLKITRFLFLFLPCVINFTTLFAQTGKKPIDSLIAKIGLYGNRNTSATLFTCFDKTAYVNSENVWFTAYLLNYSSLKHEPTILSAILVNDQTGSIALDQKYDMANGLSFGHAIIPDSIPPGDYTFITYTNILTNGRPKDVFYQPISIKTASETAFFASLSLVDSAKAQADNSQQIVLTVETKAHVPIKDATATWDVGILNNQTSSGRIKTDAEGKYLLSVPRDQIVAGRNFLNVQVTYKNEVRNVKMLLPVKDEKPNIGFYPEGGSLTNGLGSTIGWEAKSAYGRPLTVNGVLYQDNQIVDTIHTDRYGMGRFKLLPRLNSKYELKLIGYSKSISYTFPRILAKGIAINVHKAIADDSLQLKLISNNPGKFRVVVHNFRQVFYSFPVEVTAAGKKVLVNLADLPKGLSAVTIVDSLLRPCAERIFFAHYNRRSPLAITTDRPDYTTRQKVQIKLKMLPALADSLKGIVTVACVQSSKMEVNKNNDIESYHYLKQDLAALPVKEVYMGQSADDKDYLENVLLIKGWRKYSWQDMARNNTRDSIADENQLIINGSVTKNGRPLKKPIKMILSTDSATKIITTGANGSFELDNGSAITTEGRKIHLRLTSGISDNYQIKMKDPFKVVTSALITELKPVNYTLTPVPIISSDSSAIKGLDHVIRLKEVKITGRKDDTYNLQQRSISGKNECGDYVCHANFLNCTQDKNDSRNRPPVVGEAYYSESSKRRIVYRGCTAIPKGPAAIAFYGLNYSKEFYGSDYAIFNPPEPEYQSTIYWKHAALIGSKETVFEFYTSDITGNFSIIVQGVSSNGLIYEKKEFLVKKK